MELIELRNNQTKETPNQTPKTKPPQKRRKSKYKRTKEFTD